MFVAKVKYQLSQSLNKNSEKVIGI